MCPGTDVIILKIFLPKNFGEKIGVFDSKQSQILKKMIVTLGFEKNANFFAENCLKSPKIVIVNIGPRSVCAEKTFF
jgi:hypothetical protein